MTHRLTDGLEFDAYAEKPPKGPWEYILDDYCMFYNQDSPLWPFWTLDHRTDSLHATVARIAPDTEHRSWRQEYVLAIYYGDDNEASVSFGVLVEPKKHGGIVARCHARMNLDNFRVRNLDCHSSAEGQALVKLEKLKTFFIRSQYEAEIGILRPLTSHDVWWALKGRYEYGSCR